MGQSILRLLSRIIPNAIVIAMAVILCFCSNFILIPDILVDSRVPLLWVLDWLLIFCVFFMWLWSWTSCAVTDPGSIKEDLQRRHLLLRMQQGDFPACLRHLALCPVCSLPRPKGASHCYICGVCHLRQDHHCIVTGSCIADKNFKAFILSFFWGGILGLIVFPSGIVSVIEHVDPIPLAVAIYSGSIAAILFCFGANFLNDSARDAEKRSGVGDIWAFLETFGDEMWMRFLPIQKTCTAIAWPEVDWADEEIPLI
jgi:hypothetical protein